MAEKNISGDANRPTPPNRNENIVSLGHVVHVHSKSGTTDVVSELRRTEQGVQSINAGLDRLLAEMPPEGKRMRTDLARVIIEERE